MPGSHTLKPYIGAELADTLCEQFERTVGADNCVRFDRLTLQISADACLPAGRQAHRCHYVKARVRVHRRADQSLAIFHGPRLLACFDAEGKPFDAKPKATTRSALKRAA